MKSRYKITLLAILLLAIFLVCSFIIIQQDKATIRRFSQSIQTEIGLGLKFDKNTFQDYIDLLEQVQKGSMHVIDLGWNLSYPRQLLCSVGIQHINIDGAEQKELESILSNALQQMCQQNFGSDVHKYRKWLLKQ